jgi:hypothetical protein
LNYDRIEDNANFEVRFREDKKPITKPDQATDSLNYDRIEDNANFEVRFREDKKPITNPDPDVNPKPAIIVDPKDPLNYDRLDDGP